MATSTTIDHGDERLTKDPIYQPQRTLKVVVIGAGAAGLLVAYKLQRHFKDLNLKVFEKNPAVSGTWFENVGVCLFSMRTHKNTEISHLLIRYRHTQDVPVTFLPTVSLVAITSVSCCILCSSLAIGYTWSFEPKTDWSANYASASEIRQYFTNFCTRHGLQKYIELEHQVLSAEWSKDDAQWQINVEDLRTNTQVQTTAHVLISATGILNKWKLPLIPGLHSFKGKLLHSAAWDKTVNLSDKIVALIGNG